MYLVVVFISYILLVLRLSRHRTRVVTFGSQYRQPSVRSFAVMKLLAVAVFLSACTPQASQVNSNPIVASGGRTVPESQQVGYMRIIGDLRWDKLRREADWAKMFPKCWHNKSYFNNTMAFGAPRDMFSFGDPQISKIRIGECDCGFALGGLFFVIRSVSTDKNQISGKESTSGVALVIPDPASRRAFKASIIQKYNLAAESASPKYCSKYTCFEFNDGIVFDNVTPTPYTISILDAIRVDAARF